MEEPLILDRYRPLARLGSGGHGSVVLAFDTKMARRVAIKRLPLPRTRSGTPVPRTGLAEARTAALLNHPNIVTVHEWDTDSDEAFIVMEDLDGASLSDLLDGTGEPLTADETAAVVAAVAPALAYAHANGVLHLDLKPSNVLVTREGIAKIADFGVSALTDASGHASGTAGTIGYMPPEQLRAGPLDGRTDTWALAALTYELLTNANPFDADTAEGSLFKIEVAEVPAPSEFEPGLSPHLDDVLLQALAPDPAERYPSAEDFRRAVAPLLGDPVSGMASLRALVSGIGEDEDAGDLQALGLWDRTAHLAGPARRVAAALCAGWLAWAGVMSLGVGLAPLLAGVGLVAGAGAVAPGLGIGLGLAAFAVGVALQVGWPAGLALGVAAAGFWLGRGRLGKADALAPVLAPLLAIARAATAVPLLLGFVFAPLPAALASGMSALAVAGAAAAAGASAPLLRVSTGFASAPIETAAATGGFLPRVLDPGLGFVVLAWMASAAACSLICRRATKGAGLAGVLVGGVVLAAGYAGWSWLAPDAVSPGSYAPDLAIGIALAVGVASLGAPTRAEEE